MKSSEFSPETGIEIDVNGAPRACKHQPREKGWRQENA